MTAQHELVQDKETEERMRQESPASCWRECSCGAACPRASSRMLYSKQRVSVSESACLYNTCPQRNTIDYSREFVFALSFFLCVSFSPSLSLPLSFPFLVCARGQETEAREASGEVQPGP